MPILIVKTVKGKKYSALQFETRALPYLINLYDQFIINKVKSIPDNIYNQLTPEALAHWIMGDGFERNKGVGLRTLFHSRE